MTVLQATQRYSTGAIVLHWLIALALAGEIALGFAMPKDASGFAEYQLHKSIGITILVLTLLRLGWRVIHSRPAPIEGGLTGFLARAVHFGFYVLLIAMPLTGWALVSSDEIDVPTLLYGTVPLPHLPLGEEWNGLANETHEWLAWGALALFALHVAGALRHHYLIKDGLLARMSPRGGGHFAIAMTGLVLATGLLVFLGVGQERELAIAPPDVEGSETATMDDELLTASPTPEATETAESEEEELAEDETANPEDAEDALATAPEPSGPPPSWTIRPGGSLRFTVDNAGSALNGSFANWSGDIVMDPDEPETAEITIRVDLASASLGDATQDNMLRGSNFLDTSAFPQAVWRSTAVRRVSGNSYEADGTLSLKGASRPQRIRFTLSGSGNRRSVEGSASVDRNAFSVGTGSNAENLSSSVRVNFAFDATS
ncbi:cytochrome b/b6 domain-containing protein [Aurantiacibacter poecillastricola]|uniref:cytochrome b/b6 domain-containing protein n=1 Tax=Aurantiacibacter poecillastricola TaxID=3064385 RepID=UPI00273F9975|nr:cytochrome b/b6 domain-containing protein [Aurantiacibacter sp. 219JJ12-13]MDP5262658.1 cytochrome b/b6 domain-containing protein [Aurantiacibacter sp. 219JJ12-13]